MEKLILKSNFRYLRNLYKELKTCIENFSGTEIKSFNDGIGNDLGMDGDDAYDLIEMIIKKYNLNTEGYNFRNHFQSEEEILLSLIHI